MSGRMALFAALVAYLLCAPSAVNAERVTITGAVTGPDGRPVPDSRVGTLHPPGEGGWEWVWAETTTDAQGRFRLAFDCPKPPHPYAVSAAKEGTVPGSSPSPSTWLTEMATAGRRSTWASSMTPTTPATSTSTALRH